MTDTTPILGFPYPEPSDARGAGANAIRDLALALEDRERDNWTIGTVAGDVALANNTWTAVTWTAAGEAPDADFALVGDTITYTGAGPRLVLVGYSVGLFGVTTNARLTLNGANQPITAGYNSTDQFGTLTQTTIVAMTPGYTVKLSVLTGTSGGPGNQSDASLFVACI